MNRKQRRAIQKKVGKESSEKLADKIFQFDKLPDMCLACTKPFDKESKEMAMTWNVVIADQNTVRLYCPDCWDMACKIAEEYKKEKESD
tara:strand:- start:150 stop:416 length:267 start_codon:yes stop_codon:yes gene_type:complete